jgi:hydrogenase maturation factor
MQIKAVDGFTARCEAKGVERDVSLFMMQDDFSSGSTDSLGTIRPDA